ncbi:hypothetical protein SDC9_52652 [bioreactor metagenome]|uniref:Uncharacterized protein n=1 Tax=bioreactor metagenome TaxID=1076179 RepID=A0A644WWB6_9ZZZZ
MMINSGMLHMAAHVLAKELPKAYRDGMKEADAEEIEEIVNTHAIGAAAAGLAAGWIPGAGGTAALMASAGFVWSMYYRINKKIGIPLSKTVVKSLGAAVLTNLAGTAMALVGGTILATVLSFTGIGNAASSLIMAGLDYAVVLVSGVIYLKLLIRLFKAGNDPSDMSVEDLKSAANHVIQAEDVNQMLQNAKDSYKAAYKSGKITGKESVTLENDDE